MRVGEGAHDLGDFMAAARRAMNGGRQSKAAVEQDEGIQGGGAVGGSSTMVLEDSECTKAGICFTPAEDSPQVQARRPVQHSAAPSPPHPARFSPRPAPVGTIPPHRSLHMQERFSATLRHGSAARAMS